MLTFYFYLGTKLLKHQPFSEDIKNITAQPMADFFLKGAEKIFFISAFIETVKTYADNFGSIACTSVKDITGFAADEIDLIVSGNFLSDEKQIQKTAKLILSSGCRIANNYMNPLTPILNKIMCSTATSIATELIKTKGDLSINEALYKGFTSGASSFVKEFLLNTVFSKTSLIPHFAGLFTDMTLTNMKSNITKSIKFFTEGKADIDHINLPHDSTHIDSNNQIHFDDQQHIELFALNETSYNIDKTLVKANHTTYYATERPATDHTLYNHIESFIIGETLNGELPLI